MWYASGMMGDRVCGMIGWADSACIRQLWRWAQLLGHMC
jgi:hypothetical protein